MAILGELEQKIMNVIWESNRPLKPREVLTRMNSKLAYTTVMTVMKRLSDKGLLERRKKGNVFLYQRTEPKQVFAKGRLSELYGDIVDSYGSLAIAQFVDTLRSNPEDLQILKRYLESDS